jgi:hypothetical protein
MCDRPGWRKGESAQSSRTSRTTPVGDMADDLGLTVDDDSDVLVPALEGGFVHSDLLGQLGRAASETAPRAFSLGMRDKDLYQRILGIDAYSGRSRPGIPT